MKFKGHDFDFNPLNEHDLERVKTENENLQKRFDEAVKAELAETGGNAIDALQEMKLSTQVFCDMFNAILGEGASEKLLGGRPYYQQCIEVFEEFCTAVIAEGKKFNDAKLKKYSPVGKKGKK